MKIEEFLKIVKDFSQEHNAEVIINIACAECSEKENYHYQDGERILSEVDNFE